MLNYPPPNDTEATTAESDVKENVLVMITGTRIYLFIYLFNYLFPSLNRNDEFNIVESLMKKSGVKFRVTIFCI